MAKRKRKLDDSPCTISESIAAQCSRCSVYQMERVHIVEIGGEMRLYCGECCVFHNPKAEDRHGWGSERVETLIGTQEGLF